MTGDRNLKMTCPLAITMGDPGGIGPEVALAAMRSFAAPGSWPDDLVVYGDPEVLARAAATLGISLRGLDIVATSRVKPAHAIGQVSAASGEGAYRALRRALDDVLAHRVAGLVTAPLSKAALNLAGHAYPGHTEILAEAAGGVPVRMMLANDELAVVLVTIHQPLREAIAAIDAHKVAETIRLTDAHFVRFEGLRPRIAVAGLNPHAGEGGLLGSEEMEILEPAIARCRSAGIEVSGPFPPDTVFMRARGQQHFDVVIAQYHDQGLIPVKYLGVEHGVNITIGLPFIRTSPDHGTALDIAGKGKAGFASMRAAIERARRYRSTAPSS
jgi:4-hydroxythreonine-4-phosphate dehydrogenase